MGNLEIEWPFTGLQMFGYDLIVADPPWFFEVRSEKGEGKSPQAHYPCMKTPAICALPVGHLAGPDCFLFLWTTAPMLREGFTVLDAWGFKYKTTMAWQKLTKNGKTAMGPGYIVRSMHENLLIGTMGDPDYKHALHGLFPGVRREHSRKPEEFYQRVEKFAPNARRLDLFSRAQRPGWDNWGDERFKFNEAPQ